MKTTPRSVLHACALFCTVSAMGLCMTACGGEPPGESVGSASDAIGEAACATEDNTNGRGQHVGWSGTAADGATVTYVGSSFVTATSPDATYGTTACASAFVADVYSVTDTTKTRIVDAYPQTMPTDSASCSALVQEASVYYHLAGNSWSNWTQVGGASKVYQWGATWNSNFNECLMNSSGIPDLPKTGINEIRVASLSLSWPFTLLPTVAGIDEF